MYTEPEVADVKRKFPGFIGVADEVVELFLAEAISMVGDTWVEKDRRNAQLYYTAHLLAAQGFTGATVVIDSSGNISAEESSPVNSNRVTMHKVGDVQIQYEATNAAVMASNGQGTVGGSNGQLDLSSTVYGQMYLRLMRLSFPAIGVV